MEDRPDLDPGDLQVADELPLRKSRQHFAGFDLEDHAPIDDPIDTLPSDHLALVVDVDPNLPLDVVAAARQFVIERTAIRRFEEAISEDGIHLGRTRR
jgi:hypothetical protein